MHMFVKHIHMKNSIKQELIKLNIQKIIVVEVPML